MPKRKSARPRSGPGPIRAYVVPALLWLGILITAWVSVSKLSGDQQSANQQAGTATADQQQRHERNSPSSMSSEKANGHDEISQQFVSRLQIPAPTKQEQSASQARRSTHATPSQQRAAESSANDKPSSHEIATTQTAAASNQRAASNTQKPTRSPTSRSSAKSTGSAHIARAQLTSGIKHHEPIDRITGVFHSKHQHVRHIYYFTEITGLRGETVTHRWWHDGRLLATVSFRITSNSWRAFSTKTLIPSMKGTWRVVATDSRGRTLSSARFVYKTP